MLPFQLKLENFFCILDVHLHNNIMLEDWKCTFLKMDFKEHVFKKRYHLYVNDFVKIVHAHSFLQLPAYDE